MAKDIIFHDARENIYNIPDGLVTPLLNMVFVKELTAEDCSLVFGMNPDGTMAAFLESPELTEDMATIRPSQSFMTAVKEVKKLGNSVAVPIAYECKIMNIRPGDKVKITIEKM